MSKMSFHFARALSAGRVRGVPLTRETILAGLLQKRAAAARAGLRDLEDQLRSQIRWSLPVHSPSPEDGAAGEHGSLAFRVTGAPDHDPG
jgi:hypothetical protein